MENTSKYDFLNDESNENDKFHKFENSCSLVNKVKDEIEKIEEIREQLKTSKHSNDNKWKYAVIIENKPYLNDAGLGLNIITDTDIEHNVNQQISFSHESWNSVMNSYTQKGMVWDIVDIDNINPLTGTPFYLFPFDGCFNQNSEKNCGKLNEMSDLFFNDVNTFQMMPESTKLKSMQSFKAQLL